jgi:RNA polymerase sigma-70 factor (ECF subfamily)
VLGVTDESIELPTADDAMSATQVEQLIAGARVGEPDQLGPLLQLYRNYLTILAGTQLHERLRRRVSPSDVVQEAMLAAHRDFVKFRGCTEQEFLCWLRQVLINTIHHLVDTHLHAQRRDLRREVSIEQMGLALNRSAEQLTQALADPGPSPSAPARRHEAAVNLANQLARLNPDYRDVIVLRALQGLSFDEVAERMERSSGAVRMLWLRAIEKFKQIYESEEH